MVKSEEGSRVQRWDHSVVLIGTILDIFKIKSMYYSSNLKLLNNVNDGIYVHLWLKGRDW